MMLKYVLFFAYVVTAVCSCSVENVNRSPLNDTFAQMNLVANSSQKESISEAMEVNVKIAELTNLLARIPDMSEDKMNKEISHLKSNVMNFIYAYEAYNIEGQKRYIAQIQKNYKQIYTLQKKIKLNEETFAMLNYYLVKIKGSLSNLNEIPIEIPQQ